MFFCSTLTKQCWSFLSVTYPNPITPKSDYHLISPYNITLESNIKVMRIMEMINRYRSSWLLSDKFSLSAPQEMYREQYGEYAYWCWVMFSFDWPGVSELTRRSSSSSNPYSSLLCVNSDLLLAFDNLLLFCLAWNQISTPHLKKICLLKFTGQATRGSIGRWIPRKNGRC